MKHESTNEPVAKVDSRFDSQVVWYLDQLPKDGTKLYTSPPQRPSRSDMTWVGLTPQERDEINEQVYGAVPHHVAFHAAIEAKLREKNSL